MNIDLDAIFANAPSPYILLDPDLRMVWANTAYLEVTGRTRDSIIGKLMTEEFPAQPESVSDEMLRGSFRRVLTTGKPDHLPLIPYPIEDANGHLVERYWSATHTPILNDEGRVEFILQNTVDVTDLYLDAQIKGPGDILRNAELMQRAEAVTSKNLELGKATEFFQSAFEQAPGFMAVLNGPQHVFQFVNQAYIELIGARDVVGLPVRKALPDIEGQGFYEMLDQVFQSGEPLSDKSMSAKLRPSPDVQPEEHFVDFIFYPLKDSAGAPTGIFVQGHDVTDQKNAEAALTATREKFRTMAQTMPVHVWTADKDGGLNWLNVRIYEFTGYSEGDLFGAEWGRVVHPDDLRPAVESWNNAIQDVEGYETEFRIRKADGTYRWHLVRAAPLRGDDGTLTGWVGTNTDIEDRKNSEAVIAKLNSTLEERVEKRTRELDAVNAELRQSQKLESIGSLAGGIAHDFNNLLQVIMGNLQSAMRNVPEDSTVQKRLEQAEISVKRGATLASQLLSFARKQPLSPVVINMSRLVENTKEILHSAVGQGIELEALIDEGLWNTSVDPNSMENALLNLAINSRDAMSGQGKLTINAANVVLGESFVRLHPDVSAGEYIRLAVSDTGCGMSQETADRIFEPFFTTKESGRGTGLGLSMVYGFAKQSGGHMTVETQVGEGTTISIYLPRSLETEMITEPAGEHRLIGGTETILLVEDDDSVRDTTFNLLSELGYTVIQAPDAEEALAKVKEGHHIDLVFTDVVMPGAMNGHDLALQVANLRPEILVLFTSGFVQDTVFQNGRLLNGVQLISKPYTQVELANKLREVIGREGKPLAQRSDRAEREPNSNRVKSVEATDGLRLLVCEDDALIRMDITDMLRDAGHHVFESSSADGALTLLKTEKIDMLITDVGLPDRTGLELAEEARELNSELPVVFATGGAHAHTGTDLGNCTVLNKPFSDTDLLSAIKALMFKR